LTGSELKVYCALATFADAKGRCFPSKQTIGRVCGIPDLSQVRCALKSLEERGVINRDIRVGAVSLYTLHAAPDCDRVVLKPQAEMTTQGATSFVYVNAAGVPVGKTVRTDNARGKRFALFRWDGARYVRGLNGATLPWFHLDEVLGAIAAGELVIMAEGERKSDILRAALREAGLRSAVTTIAGGAKAQLTAEHLEQLHGARVVAVLADSDPADKPGRSAARERAQRVADAYLSCDVRCVDLFPERMDSSDVADWIEEGRSIDELLERVRITLRTPGKNSSESPGEKGVGKIAPESVGSFSPPELTNELTTRLRRKRESIRSPLVVLDTRTRDSVDDPDSPNSRTTEKGLLG
jgi:hypothetical protein